MASIPRYLTLCHPDLTLCFAPNITLCHGTKFGTLRYRRASRNQGSGGHAPFLSVSHAAARPARTVSVGPHGGFTVVSWWFHGGFTGPLRLSACRMSTCREMINVKKAALYAKLKKQSPNLRELPYTVHRSCASSHCTPKYGRTMYAPMRDEGGLV